MSRSRKALLMISVSAALLLTACDSAEERAEGHYENAVALLVSFAGSPALQADEAQPTVDELMVQIEWMQAQMAHCRPRKPRTGTTLGIVEGMGRLVAPLL